MKRHNISQKERHSLNVWLEKNHKELCGKTYLEAALFVSKKLGFFVGESSLKTSRTATGASWDVKPDAGVRTFKHPPKIPIEHRFKQLEAVFVRLCVELGFDWETAYVEYLRLKLQEGTLQREVERLFNAGDMQGARQKDNEKDEIRNEITKRFYGIG
jgi:hypothetical protein